MVVELNNHSYFAIKGIKIEYPDLKSEEHYDIQKNRKVEFLSNFVNGRPVWIRIEGGRRNGSIARAVVGKDSYLSRIFTEEKFEELKDVSKLTLAVAASIGHENAEQAIKILRNAYQHNETYLEYVGRFKYSFSEFYLQFDDGKIVSCDKFSGDYDKMDTPQFRTFTWLKDYTGPSVYSYNVVAKADKIVEIKMRDNVGQQINTGDAVVLVLQNEMILGNVMGPTGTGNGIHITSFSGKKYNTSSSARVLVINNETKTHMMLTKLKG